MPRLHNDHTHALFSAHLHRSIPALSSVEISDAEADMIPDHGVWRIERPTAEAPVKRTVTRGGKRAETTTAPVMEQRG